MSQELRPLYGELVITPPVENQPGISDELNTMQEQARLTIEKAAYYLAEKRGYAPGYELEDWLQAETQVKKS